LSYGPVSLITRNISEYLLLSNVFIRKKRIRQIIIFSTNAGVGLQAVIYCPSYGFPPAISLPFARRPPLRCRLSGLPWLRRCNMRRKYLYDSWLIFPLPKPKHRID